MPLPAERIGTDTDDPAAALATALRTSHKALAQRDPRFGEPQVGVEVGLHYYA